MMVFAPFVAAAAVVAPIVFHGANPTISYHTYDLLVLLCTTGSSHVTKRPST